MSKVEVHFGAMCLPLKEQVPSLGDADAARLQAFANAITLLNVHGLLTEAEVDRARKRLMKEIVRSIDDKSEER